MSLVSERCKNCRYKGEVLFGELCCDYILITGEKRGCPAGDECDKFEEKEQMKYRIFNEDCVATMQRMIRGGVFRS